MPDEISLPTEDELRELPRRAVVAFAARCARRVQPLFEVVWPDVPSEHLEAIDQAISLAETSVRRCTAEDAIKYPARISTAVADANAAVDDAAVAAGEIAALIAHAAAYTAKAAEASYAAANALNGAVHADTNVAYAGANAVNAAAKAVNADTSDFIRQDFARLRRAVKTEGWRPEGGVLPKFFGPMWPDGEPVGWPTSSQPKDTIQDIDQASAPPISIRYDPEAADRALRILVDADVDRDVFAEFLAEFASFYSELSDGDELIIRDGHVFTFEREPVPS